MKTTIKLESNKSFTVEPSPVPGLVKFTLNLWGAAMGTVTLNAGECGALIEAVEAASMGGLRCHGDHCAAGQLPCPTPKECGCAE